jgi:hypothetical protein
MSRTKFTALFLALLLLTASLYAGSPSGGDYVVTRSTIDGGGGVSAGGDFVLTGTIGQPDAGIQASTGDAYALAGGFWGRALVEWLFKDGFE